jgi:hypothetical protein
MHHIPEFYVAFFDSNALLVSALVVLTLLGVYRARRNTVARIMFVFLCLYGAFYVFFNIPDYFWYYGYGFLALYTFAFWGFDGFEALLQRIPIVQKRRLCSSTVVTLALLLFVLNMSVSNTLLRGLHGQLYYKEIGEWIRRNTEPEAKIACIEIGHIGWYSERYIIDMLGLVNPYTADMVGRRDFHGWLNYYTPDYIVTWVPLRAHEVSIQTLLDEGRYFLYREFGSDYWKFNLLKKSDPADGHG